MGRFAKNFARFIGWNFVVILIIYFTARLNLKFIQALVASFASLVPGFSYWDLVMPFYLLFFFLSWWNWLRPSAIGGRRR